MLAAKTSLCARVDALGEETKPSIGIDCRAKIEERLRQCEQGKVGGAGGEHSGCGLFPTSGSISFFILFPQIRKISGTGKAMAKAEKYEMKRSVTTHPLLGFVPNLSFVPLSSPLHSPSSPLPSSTPLPSPFLPPLSSPPLSSRLVSTPQQYSTAADFTLEGSGKRKRKRKEEGEVEVKQEATEDGGQWLYSQSYNKHDKTASCYSDMLLASVEWLVIPLNILHS